MPFMRRRARRGSRYAGAPANMNVRGGVGNFGANYKSDQTGIRRHQVINPLGALATINLGDYQETILARFNRSFGAGSDDEPTATASNNFQSVSVMNGSAIRKFTAKIKLSNNASSNGVYIDVYELTYSFGESLYQDEVYGAFCPVEFTGTAGGVDERGNVNFKAPHITWTENNYKNFKGLQRHIKFLGTMFISSEDGGTPAAEFMIQGLPAKCRRSQTGMFYGLILHYSSTKNNAATANIDASIEINFEEIPANNRLPFLW